MGVGLLELEDADGRRDPLKRGLRLGQTELHVGEDARWNARPADKGIATGPGVCMSLPLSPTEGETRSKGIATPASPPRWRGGGRNGRRDPIQRGLRREETHRHVSLELCSKARPAQRGLRLTRFQLGNQRHDMPEGETRPKGDCDCSRSTSCQVEGFERKARPAQRGLRLAPRAVNPVPAPRDGRRDPLKRGLRLIRPAPIRSLEGLTEGETRSKGIATRWRLSRVRGGRSNGRRDPLKGDCDSNR